MNDVKVAVKVLDHAVGMQLPSYATTGSAGMDLTAALEEAFILEPGERTLISTGLSIALPLGYEAQIRPRSGLALKNGITVLNTPGTVDADYRGEIKVILANLGTEEFTIERGKLFMLQTRTGKRTGFNLRNIHTAAHATAQIVPRIPLHVIAACNFLLAHQPPDLLPDHIVNHDRNQGVAR